MIIVTGATGTLNGATVERLLELMPASELGVAVRDPQRAAGLAERGVEVRHGDYAEPASLAGAFAGADQVLLVSSNDPRADAVSLHRAAIEAATTARVGRILYTSHQGAHPDTPFGPGRDHAATEQLLARSGVPWTALRNGFYAHSLEWLLGPWRDNRVIRVPADGPVSWTAREDAAEAAAVILASDRGYNGPVTITAPAAPTFTKLAEILSELTDVPIRAEVVGPEAWTADQIAAGHSPHTAESTLGMYEAAAGGYFADVDPLLGQLLGREPRSARDTLAHLVDRR